ncbi:DNA (cytosine-5-)-methyltransferase [Candidatus Poriferisodalis sp.]|uniref:DNA (cytosine-5-)-methyltransferase n=1 Tax=Candidatus Poriferisodalis sp. TaxID=3101277 RepID=UPI003B5A0905
MTVATAAATSSDFGFVDLFAGIGGMRKGFESAGGECVFTCEWDKYSQQTYRANFGDEDIAGDIREVPASDVPDHDVLLAGFPCQPFSIAGVSKKNALDHPHGFACEAQGTLFFEVARILEHCRPRMFLLENVRNLVSHDSGRTFRTICRVLREELGYEVSHRVVNARAWVPQNRERIFILGVRDGTPLDLDDLPIPDVGNGPLLDTVLHPEDGSEVPEPHYTLGDDGQVSDRYTLSDHLWTYLQDYATKHRERGNGFGYGLVDGSRTARTLSARYYKDGSEILVDQVGENPRRLTPRECARLMGFDALDAEPFQIPVSDTQAYRQFGNAVVVPVVEHLADYVANAF